MSTLDNAQEFSTAVYINTATRDLEVFMASVTQLPRTPDRAYEAPRLVLRHAVKLGNLARLLKNRSWGLNFEFPIILSMRGYSARSSEGFVMVTQNRYMVGTDSFHPAEVVGMLGFPWQQRPGLSKLKTPEMALVFHPEARVKPLSTHLNSNSATAFAAEQGIKLLAQLNDKSVFILEGQSDETHGYQIEADLPHLEGEKAFRPVWPAEHSKVFAPAEIETDIRPVRFDLDTAETGAVSTDFADDEDGDFGQLGQSSLAKLRARARKLDFETEE
jgi:hypothetical protein